MIIKFYCVGVRAEVLFSASAQFELCSCTQGEGNVSLQYVYERREAYTAGKPVEAVFLQREKQNCTPFR